MKETQTCRERVEEDAEEEEDEEEDDEEDDKPLEAPPQDEPEGLIGGGEPQEGGLWPPGRRVEGGLGITFTATGCVFRRVRL